MKRLSIIIGILGFLAITTTPAFAHSGCCSHHGGVSGCGCADGTPLSNTCAPYYPECSNTGGVQQQTQTAPQTQTYVAPPTAVPTFKPYPTITPKPTAKPLVKKKIVKHTVKRKPKPTPTRVPTPTPTKSLLKSWFGWL